MNEQKLLNKQFFKFIRYNLITFILIFIIFGVFFYVLVTKITYTSVNIELKESVQQLVSTFTKNDRNLDKDDLFINNITDNDIKTYSIAANISNPKVICIIRDDDGDIIGLSGYSANFSDYALELDFDEDLTNRIYEVVIDKEYHYKAITVDLSEIDKDEEGYVQLLINVDLENELIQIYSKIIFFSVLFGILISIIASILMSRKTLQPLHNMLKKQNEFVQNVSHELRTPLTIIQAKQELLLRDPEAKIIDKTEDISLTLNETKRLSKLIKDLMLLTRADSKQMVLQKEETEIDEFIENIGKTYNELFEIENKTLKLNLNYGKLASIDTNRIYQVMVILLDNALKYTEAGDTVEISTYQKDNKCVIEVKDTGIGISDEAIKHVFERFYREDKARSRETGGTGLGLSIADMIVSSHGGTIKAAHNGNKGTVFTIRLPR